MELSRSAGGGATLTAHPSRERASRPTSTARGRRGHARRLAALGHFGMEAETSFDSVRFGGNDLTRIALLGGLETTGLNVLDLVRPRSERFALDVLRRALGASMRGREVRVVSPEDFVLLKTLSTRERDVEDAASVL